MTIYDKITPEGTRDLLFEQCDVQNGITGALRKLFEEEGYREVKTPGFEFYDAFASKTDYYPQEGLYTLPDSRGRLITVRPDSTIPIARMTASKLRGHSLPIKLYYLQDVFRRQPEHSGKNAETLQMGMELIGAAGFEADIEALGIAARALQNAAPDKFRIEIGHMGVYNQLMSGLDMEPEDKILIHRYIAAKNYSALNDILDSLSDSRSATILSRLPGLFGGAEVLAEARALMGDADPALNNILQDLEKLFQALSRDNPFGKVIIDFGLVNQADYYSSLVFRGYIEGSGVPVLSGGRYDDLLSDFGENIPAVGFALNIDQLTNARLRSEFTGDRAEDQAAVSQPDPDKLRIALTKGRLEDSFIDLMEEAGFDCSEVKSKGRKLLLEVPGANIELFLAKAHDVLTYVEHGVCDIGVVGKDSIAEFGGTYYEILDLGIGICRFALAAPKGKDFYSAYDAKVVATKYPNVANRYFEKKGMDVNTIKIEGSVEIAPLVGLADGIVDIVQTGSTLKENGLEVVEYIQDISARLIVNSSSMKIKKDSIDSFSKKLEEVKE